MARGRSETFLLVAVLGACGGRAGEPGASAAAGSAGARASGAAGSDVSFGAGPSGSAGAADPGALARGGAGSSALAGAGNGDGSSGVAAHCDDSHPLPEGGGYVKCTDGLLRRASAATCTSSLPRAKPDTPLAFDECTSDSDCTASPHGFCAYGECKYGCVSDAECPSDQACFCGTAIGACVPANCRSDADCPASFGCVAYVAPGFALPDALACRSPADECLTTPQCNSLNPRVSCRFQVDHRICYQDLVG